MEFINNQLRNVVSRDKAEEILKDMKGISSFRFVTVADIKDLCDIESNYTDNHFGWTGYDLNHVHISRSRTGYAITFPTSRSIKEYKPHVTRVSYRKYYDPRPVPKPEPVYITVNTSDLENLGDTLGSVFEYVSSITNREVHITIK